jgi:hypothetical protein
MPALPRRTIVIGLLAALWAASAPAGVWAATQVSYPRLLRQVESGPLIRAVINRPRGDIEIKFRNLSEWEAFYPPGARHRLQALLHARHIRVIFATTHRRTAKTPPVHHHLRYIAAGVLVALVLICAGAYLYERRRRTPAAGAGAADAPLG